MNDVGLQIVEHVYEAMQIEPEWSVRKERGFTWWGGSLAQHVWAESAFEEAGLKIFRLHARTDLLDGFTGSDKELSTLMGCMGYATLNGAIRDPKNPARIQLASSIYVHEQIADWLKSFMSLVVAIQAAEAHIIAPELAKRIGVKLAASGHPQSGPRQTTDDMLDIIEDQVRPYGEDCSSYSGGDMVSTLETLQQPPCVVAMGDQNGFCAEFPFGEYTSLLQMKTDQPHPCLGHGLLMQLKLPRTGDAKMALELNDLELRSLTRIPFVGSWWPGPEGMTHVSFFPNFMWHFGPGCIQTLTTYAVAHAHWVAREVFEVEFDFEKAMEGKLRLVELCKQTTTSQRHAAAGRAAEAQQRDPLNKQPLSAEAFSKVMQVLAEKSARLAEQSMATQSGSQGTPNAEDAGDENAATLLARAKAETNGDCRRRCGPYEAPALLDSFCESTPLMWCGNLAIATMSMVALGRCRDSGQHLIFHVLSNPFMEVEIAVHGWHPADIDPTALETALLAIAKDEAYPMLTFLPSFVLPDYSLLGGTSLKAILKHALVSGGHGGLEQACRRMRDHWCQPGRRVQAEFDAAAGQPTDETGSKETGSPVTAQNFEDWWRLVTSEDHVVVEATEMETAWTGAIEALPNEHSIGIAEGLGVHGSYTASAWERLKFRAAQTLTKLQELGAEVETNQDPPIVRVNLSRTTVSDQDVGKLWRVRFALMNLRLDLNQTAVTDASLPYLKAMAGLRWLNLTGTKVTKGVAKSLRETLPEAEIVGP